MNFGDGSDLAYTASTDGWRGLVDGIPKRVLVLEAQAPETDAEVRTEGFPVRCAAGSYVFTDDGNLDVLIVGAGEPSHDRHARYQKIEDNHPLAVARQVFNRLWPTAKSQGPDPTFQAGATVRVRGRDDTGVVTKVRWDGEQHRYTVSFADRQSEVREADLEVFDLDSINPLDWLAAEPASAEEAALRLTLHKLRHPLTDTIYSYLSSKTVYRPYQFRPVLKVIESDQPRLLIADEVGLGKTIEAGLVWIELERRTKLRRVLIVCPASLQHKWQSEMKRRFDRTVQIVDKEGITELIDHAERQERNPWYGIVSLERLRSARQLAQLENSALDLDLLIVDEAHALRNRATKSYDVGDILGNKSHAVLFLSATPLNLANDDLFNLLSLLRPDTFNLPQVFEQQLQPNRIINAIASDLISDHGHPRKLAAKLDGLADMTFGDSIMAQPEYPELRHILERDEPLDPSEIAEARRLLARLHALATIVARTRKVDVPDAKAVRQAVTLDVNWSTEEIEFYEAVHDWTRARAAALGQPIGFAIQMPLRQTASCLPAAVDKLLNHEDFMLGVDDEDDDILGIGAELAGMGALDLKEIRARAARMRDIVATGNDPKYDAFVDTLRKHRIGQCDSQLLVFAFFIPTLEYLARRLTEDGFRINVMHGGTPMEDRTRIMQAFRDGGFDILLLSEVGSEGLDFEFCDVIVNYDLPWNPMRVEQRIGRLDRFGQKAEKVFIWNFHVPGTIETDILSRLYDRIGVFEESIGPLEPILRSEMAEFNRSLFDPNLTPAEAETRQLQVAAAIADRAHDLETLDQSAGQLNAIDGLLVDGLEEGIGKGRFVGQSEILRVLRSFLTGTGAHLDLEPDRKGVLVGNGDLEKRLIGTRETSPSGSKYPFTRLTAMLSDEEPIPVTTANEIASTSDIELLSLRHPLLRAATTWLHEGRATDVGRLSRMHIDDHTVAHGEYCVLVYLLTVTGLRSRLELGTAVVDRDGNPANTAIGDRMLAAIANGEIADAKGAIPEWFRAATERAVGIMAADQDRISATAQDQNRALVAQRIASVKAAAQHRIDYAREQLQTQQDPRIRRLHEGAIRNREIERDHKVAELAAQDHASVEAQPISLIDLVVT